MGSNGISDVRLRAYSRLHAKHIKRMSDIALGLAKRDAGDVAPTFRDSLLALDMMGKWGHPDVAFPPKQHGGPKAVLVVIESPPALAPAPMQALLAPGAPVIIDVDGELEQPVVPEDTEVLGGIGW